MSPNPHPTHAPFVLIPQYFGCTVFDRSTSRYLPFDREATELLRRTATTPFFALLDAIAEPDKHDQARAFFRHFYDLGMFTIDGHFAGAVLDLTPPPDHLSGPLAVHLEVVAACNLTCSHCFAGTLPRKASPLTMGELDRLFADMAGMGSFRLGLTGGEPLLRRDLFEIIDLAAGHGLHPCVTTNGLLITEEIARKFGARRLVWLNVSLDGASAATNDAVRGQGTFEQVVEKLELLGRHTPFTLAFTIMRTNAAEVRACAELAERVGAAAAVFRPLYPVGTAARHLDELMPTFDQYHDALLSLSAEADDMRVIDPFSPLLRAETQAVTQPNYGCGAGSTVCSISVSGEVNPCSFLGSAFVAASIREQPLAAIWHTSQTFRDMRSLPGGTAETFSGGCRARALALSGSANAPDPWMQARAERVAALQPLTFYEPGAILNLARRGAGGR
jgi:radical SAM protein with 4Fe4S-binding SPASM domain